jgi:hypothetical protein
MRRLLRVICILPAVGCREPLPPGPPGVRARVVVGKADANWVEVFVAGRDSTAQARCREALSWVREQWGALHLATKVSRDCSTEELTSLLATTGERCVLVEPEDPSIALSMTRMLSGRPAGAANAPDTVVTVHTRFRDAAECARMFAESKAKHEEFEQSDAHSAREWLRTERAKAVQQRDQDCASAQEAAATCKAKKSKVSASLCEIDASRLGRQCETSKQMVTVLDEKLAAPPKAPAPFESRCAPAR